MRLQQRSRQAAGRRGEDSISQPTQLCCWSSVRLAWVRTSSTVPAVGVGARQSTTEAAELALLCTLVVRGAGAVECATKDTTDGDALDNHDEHADCEHPILAGGERDVRRVVGRERVHRCLVPISAQTAPPQCQVSRVQNQAVGNGFVTEDGIGSYVGASDMWATMPMIACSILLGVAMCPGPPTNGVSMSARSCASSEV